MNENEHKKLLDDFSKTLLSSDIAENIVPQLYDNLSLIKGNIDIIISALEALKTDNTLFTCLQKQQKKLFEILNILHGFNCYLEENENINNNVNLLNIMKKTISIVKLFPVSKGVYINLIDKNLDLLMAGNENNFKNLFINILYRSMESMQINNGGKITISGEIKNKNILLTISDTGVAYSNYEVEKYFTFANSFLKQTNAKLDIFCQEGLGTRYVLESPIQHLFRKLNNKTALVVDDEKDICDILKEYLSSLDIDVDTACNGAVALNKISKKQYDFIITDLSMPIMRGEDFINETINQNLLGKSKVIMITGQLLNSEDNGVMQLLKNKADVFIHKPFSQETILRTIKDLGEITYMSN